ncbi:unnamed protein product [Auanema sp. JU1783]|nr:unnamed protein product [Auanema sp. JU1783]
MSDQDKVEMEQVPLKSDTDAPASTEEAPAKAETVSEPKKGWFFSRKAKKPASDVEAPAEETKEEGKEESCKKKCWWNRNQKSEADQKNDEISIGINLVDRDEKGNSNHVNFGYEDIFAEAEAAHSFDCLWRLVAKTFVGTRLFIYRVLSLIVGIPAAIIFGVLFAIVTVLNTFLCVPFGKLLTVPGNWIAMSWAWAIQAIVHPVTSAIGLIFSSCTIRKYGFNSQVTEPLV